MNKCRSVAVFLLIFFSVHLAPLQGVICIELIEMIGVKSTEVTLGDIAHIKTEDAALQKQIAHLVVEVLPNVDSTRVISAFKIKKILQQAGFFDASVLGLQSRVYVDVRSIATTEIEKIIRSWVLSNVAEGTKVKIQYERLPQGWKVPATENIAIEVSATKTKVGGMMTLTLKAMSKGTIVSTAQARIRSDLFRDALVLAKPAARGEILTVEHLRQEKANITHSAGMEMVNMQDVIGKVARKDLAVGSLIYSQDIELPVLIERGSLNRIVVVNGPVQMNMNGAKALERGKKGDVVMFTNPMNSKTTVAAVVIDKNIALVNLS